MTKNLSLKLWSLLIALALAYLVNSQSNSGVITLVVPVELQNLSGEKVVLFPQLPQAQVKVRGPSFILSGITRDPPSFQVEVPKEVGNRYSVSLQPRLLDLPPSVEILGIEPSEIEFVLDRLESREVKVVVPRIGSLREDLRLDKITVDPSVVPVTGPSTELQSLNKIETAPLDLLTITGTDERALPLRVPGRLITSEVQRVNVKVDVSALQREKKLADIPVLVPPAPAGFRYSTEPNTVLVEVTGPRQSVKRLEPRDVKATFQVPDPENFTEGKVTLQVSVPGNLQLVYIKPETVQVRKLSE